MSNVQQFTKVEVLEFIEKFTEHTTNLEQPMISWVGDGAYELPEAKKMVEDGFIPEGVVMCAKRPNEEYWDSVFIMKDETGYEISTGDMSGLQDSGADNIDDALKEASILLIKYITMG
jgi:hypothetical protein